MIDKSVDYFILSIISLWKFLKPWRDDFVCLSNCPKLYIDIEKEKEGKWTQ